MSSIGRRAKRFIRDIRHGSKPRLRVPITLVTVSVVLFTAFIVSGGIYDILNNPLTVFRGPQGYIAVRGDMQEQTLMESVLSMMFTVLTFGGLLTAYKSTQVIYDSRRALTMLIIGISLLVLGLSGSYYLLNLKGIVWRQFGF